MLFVETALLNIQTDPLPKITQVEVDKYSNQLRFYTEFGEVKPISATFETSYERTKGEKVINKTFQSPDKVSYDPNNQFAVYDKVFAVDTNTRTIRSDRISVTGVILSTIDDAITYRGSLVKASPTNCIEFRNTEFDPELTGLRCFIRNIIQHPNYNDKNKICIIIDHNLDKLEELNNKNIPIIEDFYLPDGITLVYGSSDVGKNDYLPNKLLSAAHKSANEILKYIEENDEHCASSQIPNEKPSYTYYRLWIHKNFWNDSSDVDNE